MRKIIAGILIFGLLLAGAGCSSGAGNQGSESSGSAQKENAGASAAEMQDSGMVSAMDSAAETQGPTVEITLPAQYSGDTMTQEMCDATAEANGYESITMNEDGSLTYVMTEKRQQQMLQETADSIDASLESLCKSDDYPNFISIRPNEDYTEFTVFTRNSELGTEETRSVKNFYLYGGMYQAIAGNPDAVIHVTFRSSITDEVLGESDSSETADDTSGKFEDLAADSYCYDAAVWAVANGIANGTDATHFSPDADCTRAQLVTFLWRLAGQPEPELTENPYTDIPETSGSYRAVLWATEQEITTGTSDSEFSPDETVSRAQAITMIWRYAGSPGPESAESVFDDVESGTVLCSAVMWAVEQGITGGTTASAFSPDAPCTRGQIVTFLYRGYGA